MAFKIDWYIKDEIIFMYFYEKMTAEELRTCLSAAKDMIEESPRHLVHAIIDVGDVSDSVSLKESMEVVHDVGNHQRAGWMITIREKSVIVKMAAAIGRSVLNLRSRTFDTMQEAIEHLQKMDTSLQWENANKLILPKE